MLNELLECIQMVKSLQTQTHAQTKFLKGMQLTNRHRSLLQAQTIGQGKCKLHIQCRQNIITI